MSAEIPNVTHRPSQLACQGEGDSAPLTADEVARILRVPRSWVYTHLDELPTIRLGRYVRFRRSDIDAFLEQRGTCQ